MSSHELNSKNNDPVLLLKTIGIEIITVSCCLLLRMARIDLDWNLKKFGAIPAKVTREVIMVCAPWWNLLDIVFVNNELCRNILSMCKGIKYRLNQRIDLKQ